MKQMEVTRKQIGDVSFYIKPFPAFTAANISGELASTVAPLLGSLAAVLDTIDENDPMNSDIEKAMPAITNSFASLSGDKLERLMKRLLINNQNISYEDPATGSVKVLSEDAANEVFCGEMQDMFILCVEVIRINYAGFFKKIGDQFGSLIESMKAKMAPGTGNTENSTSPNLQTSN